MGENDVVQNDQYPSISVVSDFAAGSNSKTTTNKLLNEDDSIEIVDLTLVSS